MIVKEDLLEDRKISWISFIIWELSYCDIGHVYLVAIQIPTATRLPPRAYYNQAKCTYPRQNNTKPLTPIIFSCLPADDPGFRRSAQVWKVRKKTQLHGGGLGVRRLATA